MNSYDDFMFFLYLIMVYYGNLGIYVDTVSALFDVFKNRRCRFFSGRASISMAMFFGRMVQKNPHPKNGQGKPHQGEGPHHQGRPPPPKWVPHWPPNGYALVIQMPMSAEEYFPIWRREVPVPHVPAPIAPAPQQMKMGEDLPSLDDEGTTCFL